MKDNQFTGTLPIGIVNGFRVNRDLAALLKGGKTVSINVDYVWNEDYYEFSNGQMIAGSPF